MCEGMILFQGLEWNLHLLSCTQSGAARWYLFVFVCLAVRFVSWEECSRCTCHSLLVLPCFQLKTHTPARMYTDSGTARVVFSPLIANANFISREVKVLVQSCSWSLDVVPVPVVFEKNNIKINCQGSASTNLDWKTFEIQTETLLSVDAITIFSKCLQ